MRSVSLLALALLLACSGDEREPDNLVPAPAPPAPTDPETIRLSDREDTWGDRLPVGAVQRYGMQRLRHRGEVDQVVFTPDGRSLLTVGRDGETRMWRASTGERLHRLPDLTVRRLAVTPDSARMVAVDAAGGLRAVDLATGEVRWAWKPLQSAQDIAISPEGTRVAIGTGDGVLLLRVSDGRRLAHHELRGGAIGRVAWAPDGRLGAATLGGTAYVLDPASGELRTTFAFETHGAPAEVLTWSRDGRYVAAGVESLDVRDGETGEWLTRLEGGRPTAADFVDGQRILVAWSEAGRPVGLYAAPSGQPVRSSEARPSHAVHDVAVTPDGERFATGGALGEIRLWDVASGDRIRAREGHQGEVRAADFAPDGATVFTGGADGALLAWDVRTGTFAAWPDRHGGPIVSLQVAPTGAQLLTGAEDGQVRLWSTAERRLVRSYPGRAGAFAGNGVLTWAEDGTLALWQDGTSPSWTLPGTSRAFAVDAEGRRAVVGQGKELVLVDLATGAVAARIAGTSGASFQDLAWSPDGRRLAGVGAEGRVHLVDVETRRVVTSFAGPGGALTAVAWAPDGQRLATAHRYGVRLWNGDGAILADHVGHEDWVTDVTWSPDGRFVLSTSTDRTAILWDAK